MHLFSVTPALSGMINAFWTVFIFFSVVFIHELGHFMVARLCGVRISAFSVGFGKKLWTIVDRHGTEWRLCILPLGGYVSFAEAEDAVSDAVSAARSSGNLAEGSPAAVVDELSFFEDKRISAKAAIVVAGPLANYILSFLILVFIFCFWGKAVVEPEITFVQPDTPAARAGLVAGDVIVSLAQRSDFTVNDVVLAARSGKKMDIAVQKTDGSMHNLILQPEMILARKMPPPSAEIKEKAVAGAAGEGGSGGEDVVAQPEVESRQRFMGVGFSFEKNRMDRLSPVEAIGAAGSWVISLTAQMAAAIYGMLSGGRAVELSGPLKIIQISSQSAAGGMQQMLSFIALLSLNLGFLNLLPIPGLDGGHLMLYGIEGALRRPLNKKTRNRLLQIGYVLLLSLMLFAISSDVISLFKR